MESIPDSSDIVWLGYRPATWAQRLAAQLLDFIYVVVGVLLAILGLLIVMASKVDDDLARAAAKEWDAPWIVPALATFREDWGWGLFFLGVAAMLSYTVWFLTSLADGRTPGKRVAGIRVVQTTGEPIGWGGTLVREVVLKWMVGTCFGLLTVGIYCVVDYLWPLWDKNRQALHDKMAETLVVQGYPVAHRGSSPAEPAPREPEPPQEPAPPQEPQDPPRHPRSP